MSRWRQDWRGVWKATSQVSNYFVCHTFYVCLATSCLRNVKTLCLLPRELVLMDSKLNIWLSVQDVVFSSTPMVSRTCGLSGNCNLSGVMAVTIWGNISLWILRNIWKTELACMPDQRVSLFCDYVSNIYIYNLKLARQMHAIKFYGPATVSIGRTASESALWEPSLFSLSGNWWWVL